MKVSLSWLNEYVPVTMSSESLSDALTMAGLEVEAVTDRYEYLNSVVVGRVVKVTPHPNADRLRLCRVDIGKEQISVVCGAPNVVEGMASPCALPGTRFPDGTVLKKGFIRGEASEGMLCSEKELHLGTNAAGIMPLSGDPSPGTPLNQALKLSDPVFEIDLTPNRPDCLSIIGIAREVAAIQNVRLEERPTDIPESLISKDLHIADLSSVTIESSELCPRYTARCIFDVTVTQSPFWLKDRLISVGLKPINNIVDITNFVMLELGQPLHAFDFDRLSENRIVVKTAQEGQTFTTLDGKKRPLNDQVLMICDGKKQVAIGGVMGGENSEIEASTHRVFLESACFDPMNIRKTAKNLGLATDASHRFERGVDPDGTLRALNRAAALIAELGGGLVVDGEIDENPLPYVQKSIRLRVDAANNRMGTNLDAGDMTAFLESIEFRVNRTDDGYLTILPPSFRVDITRFEDITEEIARRYGYDKIETTFPSIPAETVSLPAKITSRNRIRQIMAGLGFSEAITYSFIHTASADRLRLEPDDPRRKTVEILNPISEDQAVLRTSLIPGLLETMGKNLASGNSNLKLFEIGNTFFAYQNRDEQPKEIEMLAGLWTGNRQSDVWLHKKTPCDFYDIKGVLESLCEHLLIEDSLFTGMPADSCCYTRVGHTARICIGGKEAGIVGEIHAEVLKNYQLKQSAFIFELDLDVLINAILDTRSATPPPKFPSTSRDITLIVDRNIEADGIVRSIHDQQESLIERVHLFDVFTGEPVATGKKSVSLRVVYRSKVETLEDSVINDLHGKVTSRLLVAFGADLPE